MSSYPSGSPGQLASRSQYQAMLKNDADSRTDIDWILRDRKVIDGLDHLGIELISVNLYQAMLPGITNVTERARYYSFYPWIIHRYAQEGPTTRTKVDWRNWFRSIEFTYAVACMAYEKELGQDLASSVVGADLAGRVIEAEPPSAKIDLHGPSVVSKSGAVPASGAYFKNPEGGFGQYYKVPLRELGVLVEHESPAWPDVQLSNYAGKRIAEALDGKKAFRELMGLAIKGRAQLSELSHLGKTIHPLAISPDSEEAEILRKLIFGEDADLCRGQKPEHTLWRRTSLLLMLQFLREAGTIEGSLAMEFRRASLTKCLPNGRPWKIPALLSDVALGWGAYQCNDTLNYCLECLFYSALQEIDRMARRPTELVAFLAEQAMAAVPPSDGQPRLAALPRKVADWIAANQKECDRLGLSNTLALADRLESAVRQHNSHLVAPLAVRLLGRLTVNRGDERTHPFASIPSAVEMSSVHEVHLRRWWQRVEERSEEATYDFLKELLLEWVVYRHLRVATRKLAGQGVSTFKYRPEEGQLILIAEHLPTPTYTAPRVRQGFRIMEDLHCIRRIDDGAELSEIGKSILEAHSV
jgi:hypothetical protein